MDIIERKAGRMEKLLLIDGNSILNRAFYGLPDLSTSQGVHTNAILGFFNILMKIMEEEKPDYLTVAFDVHEPTFRHEMYEAYKGTRKPAKEELLQQLPIMKELWVSVFWKRQDMKQMIFWGQSQNRQKKKR